MNYARCFPEIKKPLKGGFLLKFKLKAITLSWFVSRRITVYPTITHYMRTAPVREIVSVTICTTPRFASFQIRDYPFVQRKTNFFTFFHNENFKN